MFMKCHYQLFPFIFFNFNLEQIYFPKIQNKAQAKILYQNQELLFKDKVFRNLFLNSATNYRQAHWMLCLKSKYKPLGMQGMLVKNVTNHNALHFELLNAMHQIGCCLARLLQARSQWQQ